MEGRGEVGRGEGAVLGVPSLGGTEVGVCLACVLFFGVNLPPFRAEGPPGEVAFVKVP